MVHAGETSTELDIYRVLRGTVKLIDLISFRKSIKQIYFIRSDPTLNRGEAST